MTQHGLLDAVDYKILGILQENARLDTTQIAYKVHKSPTATTDRIRRLQDKGYIQKYVAILDRKKMGRPILMITMVRLANHTAHTLQDFDNLMRELDEVQICLHLSGKYDFLLHVTLRHPSEYKEFLDLKLCCLPIVEKIQSSLVLSECKIDPALPLIY